MSGQGARNKWSNTLKYFLMIVPVVGALYATRQYYQFKEKKIQDNCLKSSILTREAFDLVANEKNAIWVETKYGISSKEELKRTTVADQKIDMALSLCPNAGSYEIKGIIVSRQGYLNESIKYFKESIKLYPEYYWPYTDLAQVYDKLGKNNEAEKYYLLSISYGPTDPNMNRNYAQFLNRIGRKDETMKYFENAKNYEEKRNKIKRYPNN